MTAPEFTWYSAQEWRDMADAAADRLAEAREADAVPKRDSADCAIDILRATEGRAHYLRMAEMAELHEYREAAE